jgi:hypothetical protein
MSAKGRAFRRHFGGDLPAAGPSACLRSVQPPARCPSCGAAGVTIRHMPLKTAGPSRCQACCSACNPPQLPEAA